MDVELLVLERGYEIVLEGDDAPVLDVTEEALELFTGLQGPPGPAGPVNTSSVARAGDTMTGPLELLGGNPVRFYNPTNTEFASLYLNAQSRLQTNYAFKVTLDGSATAPALAFGHDGTGFYRDSGGGRIRVAVNNNYTGINFGQNGVLAISHDSANLILGSVGDTGISRASAGVLTAGNGTAGDGSGTFRAKNFDAVSSALGADIGLTINHTSASFANAVRVRLQTTQGFFDFGQGGPLLSGYAGKFYAYSSVAGTSVFAVDTTGRLSLPPGGGMGFTAGVGAHVGLDTYFSRGAAGVMELKDGANAQSFMVYRAYQNGGAEWQRLEFQSTSTRFEIQANAGGALSQLALRLVTVGAQPIEFATNNAVRFRVDASGHLLAATDNTYDIGQSGANRPRNIYASADVFVGGPGNLRWPGASAIYGGGTNGRIRLTNAAATDFNLLQFGGETAGFPALKRNSAELQARLADDSGFANVRVNSLIAQAGAAAPAVDTHFAVLYPTDTAAGKPALFFTKTTTPDKWVIQLYDNVNNAGTLQFTAGTIVAQGSFQTSAAITAAGSIKAGSYTVATMPTPTAGLKGAEIIVTDALAPTWNSLLTGGGAVTVGARCNGTEWRAF